MAMPLTSCERTTAKKEPNKTKTKQKTPLTGRKSLQCPFQITSPPARRAGPA